MTVLSNLYVEKVNSEHPLAVWMLNEDINYISHITELDRNFSNALLWQPTNCTISTFTPEPIDSPIKNTTISQISGSVPSLSTMDIEILSIYPNSFVNIVEEYKNFAIGFHLYLGDPSTESGNILTQSVSYGYKYIDPTTMLPAEDSVTETVSSIDSKTWKFFTNTFANPDPSFINPRLFIRIKVSSGGGSGDYKYLIDGFSFGQWSEDFNRSSLGISSTSPMPIEIDLPTTLDVIEASSYNNNLPAYYVCSNKKLFCKNFGIPLVYGSSNVTKIYPNVISSVTYPSLVFPGLGFLHNNGKYNEYTAEMWIRINTDSIEPKKYLVQYLRLMDYMLKEDS